MANDEHLRILQSGVYEWNTWMRQGEGGHLSSVDLSDANLSGVNLSGANLGNANLSGADLSGADLSGADLSRADLSGADLSRANLNDADLSRANLNHADLSRANLSGADLRRANLGGADISRANLSSANLSSAFLTIADLNGADLRGAEFTGAYLGETMFGNCNLRLTKGLDYATTLAPCTIGIDTIYKSEGNIPESFLRGCGVPEGFITLMQSLIGAEEGMQFHSCFISYSHEDEHFAKLLHQRMRAENLRVWFAPEDIEGGKKLHEQLETQIHLYDKLLLVLSEHSMSSEWVKTEVYYARQREKKEGRQILFPLTLCPFEEVRQWSAFDADIGKDMAREIREFFIPDFSRWKDHDEFEAGFAKLLKDLRSQTRTSSTVSRET